MSAALPAAPSGRAASSGIGRSPAWLPLGVRVSRHVPPRLGGFAGAAIMAARTSELRMLRRLPKAFTVRAAVAGDQPLLDRYFGDVAPQRRCLSGAGETWLLAVAEGEVHAVERIHWGPCDYLHDMPRLGVRFHVPARSCWLHDGRNMNAAARGPWAMIMAGLRPLLEAEGVGTAFLQVDAADGYSIAAHESLGFRTLAWLAAARLRRRYFVGVRLAGRRWAPLREQLDLGRIEV